MASNRNLKTSEVIARRIFTDIVGRGLRAGQQLKSEAAMLQEYGVGRVSLREAIRLLEVQGLVKIKAGPRGGPVVGDLDPSYLGQTLSIHFGMADVTYDELCEYVEFASPYMAEMAARRTSTSKAKEVLGPFLQKPGAAEDYSDPVEAAEQELAFHPLVYSLSGNRVMALVCNAIEGLIADHMLSKSAFGDFVKKAHGEHVKIAKAIIAGQPTKAHKLMFQHQKNVREFYKEQVPGMFSQKVSWR